MTTCLAVFRKNLSVTRDGDVLTSKNRVRYCIPIDWKGLSEFKKDSH